MCHSIPVVRALQQAIPNNCAAKTLGPGERIALGVQALAGHQTITGLADDAGVSRKFIYQQRDRAQTALDDAFTPAAADEQVLFHLPITKNWLKQAALGLTLICHSSYRGVHEFCRDLLGVWPCEGCWNSSDAATSMCWTPTSKGSSTTSQGTSS